MDALQALVDWLYKVEPQLAEDQPVHGDLDLVMNLMDAHKVRAAFPSSSPRPEQGLSSPRAKEQTQNWCFAAGMPGHFPAADKEVKKQQKDGKNFHITGKVTGVELSNLAQLLLCPSRCSRRSWGSAQGQCRCSSAQAGS